MYILRQPKRALISLVILNTGVENKKHSYLEKILDHSDIIFIFDCYGKNINKEKFTSLYNACGYIEVNESLGSTLIKTLDYIVEIFQIHSGFMIIDLDDIVEENMNNDNFFKTLENISMSSIIKPILKISRLSSVLLSRIYEESDNSEKLSWWKKIFNKKDKKNKANMYCSYLSTSDILYFPKASIIKILDFVEKDENKIVESFEDEFDYCKYIFPSLIRYMEMDFINSNIENLELN